MKLFAMMILTMWCVSANTQSLSLRAGKSFTAADLVSLRYQHYTNSSVNLALGPFMEKSRTRNLDFSAYGLDMLLEWASNREGYQAGAFGLNGGAGFTWHVVSEPWIYNERSFKDRMNYGLAGELGAAWFMTDAFSLLAFAQQKYLFRSLTGRTRFALGLGLSYRLSN